MINEYDLVVIGAGSGGVRAGRVAAGLGARVAIVEVNRLGGACVNVGCVPKKLFVYASHFGESFEEAKGFGWSTSEPVFNWPLLVDNKNREINRLNGVYRKLLQDSGVDIIEGRGMLGSATTVMVNDRQITGRHLLVATGSHAFVPDIPGRQWGVSSDAMFYLKTLPQTAVVVGAGYIAVEFAGILAGLGVRTHLVCRGSQLLKRFDADIREALETELVRKGILLHLNTDIEAVEGSDARGCEGVVLTSGETLPCNLVLFATGRQPLTQNMGLEAAGVMLGKAGEIVVDANYQTSVPTIHAVGDVIDRVQLTPVALAEGMYVANRLFGKNPVPVDYAAIPTAVFSQPSVGTIGPSEAEARQRFEHIKVYRSSFRPLKNTLSGNPELTTVKLIVDAATDRVVAAHMVGPESAEIIQGLAVAIRAGATKQIFDTTLGIHPSTAEEFVTLRSPVAG
jgi:glutathione reductase (NADPH)